jgi:hypothetical protein
MYVGVLIPTLTLRQKLFHKRSTGYHVPLHVRRAPAILQVDISCREPTCSPMQPVTYAVTVCKGSQACQTYDSCMNFCHVIYMCHGTL